jgi:DNA-binding CsgD family transcriptional regulator
MVTLLLSTLPVVGRDNIPSPAEAAIDKPFDSAELKPTIEMALYKHSIEIKLEERGRWVAATLRSIGSGVLTIDLIENDIAEITSPFIRNLGDKNFRLTFLETQIAVLIKQRKSTKEIAAILRSSPRTIEFHRQNLRKKIGLTGKDVSLESRLAEFSQ